MNDDNVKGNRGKPLLLRRRTLYARILDVENEATQNESATRRIRVCDQAHADLPLPAKDMTSRKVAKEPGKVEANSRKEDGNNSPGSNKEDGSSSKAGSSMAMGASVDSHTRGRTLASQEEEKEQEKETSTTHVISVVDGITYRMNAYIEEIDLFRQHERSHNSNKMADRSNKAAVNSSKAVDNSSKEVVSRLSGAADEEERPQSRSVQRKTFERNKKRSSSS